MNRLIGNFIGKILIDTGLVKDRKHPTTKTTPKENEISIHAAAVIKASDLTGHKNILLTDQPDLRREMTSIEPSEGDVLKSEQPTGLNTQDEPPKVIITRPWKELYSHIIHLRLPALKLLARAVTTFVLSFFRWHFCDNLMLAARVQPNQDIEVVHSLKGKIATCSGISLEGSYPYMLENALVYQAKEKITANSVETFFKNEIGKTEEFDVKKLRSFSTHFIDLSNKNSTDTLWDLFHSNVLVPATL